MPNEFTDFNRITKSHIPVANVPVRIEVPKEPSSNDIASEFQARLKRGRPLGLKDKNSRKRNAKNDKDGIVKGSPEETQNLINPDIPEEISELETQMNEELSINSTNTGVNLDPSKITMDNVFAYNVALNIMQDNEDLEPLSVEECRRRKYWTKWQETIQFELNLFAKREVFGPVVQTPNGVKLVVYKWVFIRKRNEKNEIVRYKARLVAQGFSQRPAYLYGSPDNDIYMKIPEELKMPEAYSLKYRKLYSIRLQRSLYGLKQSGRIWYNRLSEYLKNEGYINDVICPCIFIKKMVSRFVVLAIYVNDINLIGTPEEVQKAIKYLKKEFEMKNLGKTKLCLGLQIEHLADGVFIHQTAYTQKVLKRFYMDKAYSLSTSMVVRSLEVSKDPFRPLEEDEEILGPEVPYLSAIGELMYLTNATRPDIAFSVNLLARYSSSPKRRHWNGVKHILRYLKGTVDIGLFYTNKASPDLIGYADASYLSDPHKARSQTGYVFTYGGTAISWRSTKQSIVATSSNHAKIITIHEASRECIWLRSVVHSIKERCGLKLDIKVPTVIFEDNAACIAQLKEGFIKGDRTKDILPKLFFTHDLQKNGDIDVQQIRSCDNPADLFTKSLPTLIFEKMVYKIGMRRLISLVGHILISGSTFLLEEPKHGRSRAEAVNMPIVEGKVIVMFGRYLAILSPKILGNTAFIVIGGNTITLETNSNSEEIHFDKVTEGCHAPVSPPFGRFNVAALPLFVNCMKYSNPLVMRSLAVNKVGKSMGDESSNYSSDKIMGVFLLSAQDLWRVTGICAVEDNNQPYKVAMVGVKCKLGCTDVIVFMSSTPPTSPSAQSNPDSTTHPGVLLDLLFNDSELILNPLINVASSGHLKIVEAALDAVQQLIAYGYLRGEVDPTWGPDAKLLSKLIGFVCKCHDLGDDAVELLVTKCILSVVTSVLIRIHGDSLLQVVRTCYDIYMESKNVVNRTTAKASLVQMLVIVFRRMEADSSTVPWQPTVVAELMEPAEKDDTDGSMTLFVQGFITKVLAKKGELVDGERERDDLEVQIRNKLRRDPFLVFRALCKFSLKTPPKEAAADPLLMKGKIVALELLKILLENAGAIFRTSNSTMSTPFLPVLLSWTYAYDCSCYKAFDSSITLAWIAAQSQYYSRKSYNVNHGNRLQVPIFSYMVSEYRQTHSLHKPSMQTVLMLIGLDTLQEIVAVMVLRFFSSIEIDDLKEKLKMATLVSNSNSSGKKMYTLPKIYLKMQYCVSCAIHSQGG
ncbi:hypothetical protein FXO37_17067 [Capsicum annuum]|nr:hypothetical protein FXO37_17067 [Capsicum annuum]